MFLTSTFAVARLLRITNGVDRRGGRVGVVDVTGGVVCHFVDVVHHFGVGVNLF